MSWEEIPGWFGFRETYDEFVELAEDGDTIVEIGVAFGRSLAYLLRGLIDARKKCTVWACDPWVDDWWQPPNNYPLDAPRPTWGGEYAEEARKLGGPFPAFCHYMLTHAREEMGYPGLRVFKGYNHELSPALASTQGAPRFVMIDGNHNYEQVKLDIGRWWSCATHTCSCGAPGCGRMGDTILAGDDYSPDFPGVVKAVDERFPNREVRGTTWLVRT